MKLKAISVCVNYADFFRYTAEENKSIFDEWIVVTDLKDTGVTQLCEEHGFTCVKTDVFYEKGIFNKYAGINEGLKTITDRDTWILFLDSDIVLQPETRRVLEKLNLNKDYLYGVDRLNCTGMKTWQEYKISKGVLVENWMLNNAGLPIGSRLVHYYGHEGENGRFEGWRPLGYFQLAYGTAFDHYPQDTLGADHCDLLFARQWDRNKRVLIPELYAIHLETENTGKGVNWYGRKSDLFLTQEEQDALKASTPLPVDQPLEVPKEAIPTVINENITPNEEVPPTEAPTTKTRTNKHPNLGLG